MTFVTKLQYWRMADNQTQQQRIQMNCYSFVDAMLISPRIERDFDQALDEKVAQAVTWLEP